MGGARRSAPRVRVAGDLAEPGLHLVDVVVRRRVTILDHARLGVPPGGITALWGAPASGKSTLMRVAAGLLVPDRGTVRVNGVNSLLDPVRARAVTGWVPAARMGLGHVTPRELLHTFALGHALPGRAGRHRVTELLEQTGLTRTADLHAERLTLAQHTKLMLACALVHSPEVLLLDEPFAGLDAEDRAEIGDILRGQARLGAAVLATAPDPFLLDEVADRSVQIEAGRVIGSVDLRNTTPGRRWRIVSLDGDSLHSVLDRHGVDYEAVPSPDGRWSRRAAVDVVMSHEEEATALLAALARAGVPVYGFGPGAEAAPALAQHRTHAGEDADPRSSRLGGPTADEP